MRVISGSARGHKLKAPEGLTTRPTTDRIKESLFNIIAGDLYECRFLDLFSGSGAMGIEALSRGAARAVFVDRDKKSIRAIRDNLKATKLEDRAKVFECDISAAVSRLGRLEEKFDIIFMDPPYNKGYVESTLTYIVRENILDKDGYIIAEQSIEEEVPSVKGLEVIRIKDYKITKMTFLSMTEAEPGD
ncbi:MAG: 16S rRNA (guanine(966)-N(2))-methyltransferase RsmD [Clostridia bacterium]|nr:16S rRNA (guanine(966)-N(2))-methyltransferase RsmD [Clostridia bacterium]